jgi:hypothetical protein
MESRETQILLRQLSAANNGKCLIYWRAKCGESGHWQVVAILDG